MVRESRHLWVGNLPENVHEEQIADFFTRFGRVEKVKLLSKQSADGGKAAFVDFVDIRSATKANESANHMGERDLRTNYNEPGMFGKMRHVSGYDSRGPADDFGRDRPKSYAVDDNMPPRGRYRHHDDKMRHGKPQRYSRAAPESSGSDKSGSESSNGSQSDSDDSNSQSDSEGRESRKSSKPAAVCVKNLPARPSDHSLEEALFHEFKRSGEIIYTRVVGSGEQRYAVIKFKKGVDAEKAMINNGKLFLGQEMKLVPFKLDDNDDDRASSSGPRKSKSKHVGNAIEELGYDPQATRTLFIGNLEKTLTHGELKKAFDKFGEIVDVDIKKQDRGITTYAFIQYIDVGGAMRGKKSMDRQFVGRNRVKVGYGRGTPTNSIWIGNLGSNTTESHLQHQFNAFGSIAKCMIDREYLQALVWFETVDSATVAFQQTRGKFVHGKRLAVDFASRSCKEGFYVRMEQTGQLNIREMEPSPPAHPAINSSGGRGAFNRRPGGYESRGGRSNLGGRYNSEREYSSGKGESYYNNDGNGSYNRSTHDDDGDDYERELRDYGYRQKEREREKVRKPDRDNSERGYSPLSDEDQHRQAMRGGNRDSRSPMSGRGEDGGYLSDGEVRYDSRRSGMKRKRGNEEVYASPSPPHVESVVTKMDKIKRRKKERLAKKKARNVGEAEAEFAGLGSNDEEDEDISQEKLAKLERLRRKKKLALERVEEKARRKELKRLKKLKRMKSSESGPPPEEKENESGEMIDDKVKMVTEDPQVNSQDEKYNADIADSAEVFPIGKNDSEINEDEPPTVESSVPETEVADKMATSPVDTPASPSVDDDASVKLREESLSPVPPNDVEKSENITQDSDKEQSPHQPRTPTPNLDEDRQCEAAAAPSNDEEDDDDDDDDDDEDDSDKETSYRRARRERGPATPPPHYDVKETSVNIRTRERRLNKDGYENRKRDESGFRESREMRGPYNNRGSSDYREDWRDRPSRDGPKRERMSDRYDSKSRDRDERLPGRDRMRFRRSSSPRGMDQRQRSPPARYRSNDDKRPRSPLGHKPVHSPDYPRGRESPDKGRYDKRRSRQGSPYLPDRDRQKGGYGQYSQSRGMEGHDGRDRRDFSRRLDRGNMGRDESPPPPPPPPPTKHDPSASSMPAVPPHHNQGQVINPSVSGSSTMQYQMGNQPMPGGNAAPVSAGSAAQANPYTLLDLLRRYPVMWQGIFALKHNSAAIQMHFLSGNVRIAEASLPRCSQPGEVPPPLTISQRMKLEPSQLDGVNKRIQVPNDHCLLLALPCGRDPLDVHAQTRALKSGFISYLQEKQAAGIINVNSSATKQPAYVLHIFPPCDFAQSHLAKVAPDLLDSAADSGHLMVLVTTI